MPTPHRAANNLTPRRPRPRSVCMLSYSPVPKYYSPISVPLRHIIKAVMSHPACRLSPGDVRVPPPHGTNTDLIKLPPRTSPVQLLLDKVDLGKRLGAKSYLVRLRLVSPIPAFAPSGVRRRARGASSTHNKMSKASWSVSPRGRITDMARCQKRVDTQSVLPRPLWFWLSAAPVNGRTTPPPASTELARATEYV